MPHPKFYEQLSKFADVLEFERKISELDNVFEFNDDDYRSVLMNCDYYIVDRSALMVEAGITNRPILYISTKLPEPMTKPIQKIIDSYYQASTFKEIKSFLDNIVLKEDDPLKEQRIRAFKSVTLSVDGKAGHRIKEDMINSLENKALSQDGKFD